MATAYGTFSWFFTNPAHGLKEYFCEFKYPFETAKSGDRELSEKNTGRKPIFLYGSIKRPV